MGGSAPSRLELVPGQPSHPFRAQAKVVRVSFAEGHQFAGLSMSTRGLKMKSLAPMVRALQVASEAVQAASTMTAQVENLDRVTDEMGVLRGLLATHLVSWNMEYEDEAGVVRTLGITDDELALLEEDLLLNLIGAWFEAVAGVTAELGKDSGSGEISPEPSLPMEPLSPSQPS
jgi:hypothetical protein